MVNHQNELITPEKNILHGITRKNILKIADKLMSVKKRQISVEELSDAKEIFICSTTKRILPIIELNGNEINNKKVGSNTRNLFQALLQFENQYIKANS